MKVEVVKMEVCFWKMEVEVVKMEVCFFEKWKLKFLRKWQFVF